MMSFLYKDGGGNKKKQKLSKKSIGNISKEKEKK